MKAMANNQTGMVILPIIVILPFLILIATYFMNLAVASFRLATKDQFHTYAQLSTDAAIDLAMEEINLDNDWAGTGGEIQLVNDGKIKTTYEATVTSNSAVSKTITAVGRTYRPVGSATPESSVTIKADLRAVSTGGTFSLVTGVGGLYMSNSAKIVGGEVFVNGEINLQNSAQIGLTTNPLDVSVAHQNCPLGGGPTYPQLCGAGNGQPVAIQNTAHIYGNVKANNQISGASMSNPGLTAGSGVTPGALPTHDREAQKTAAINNLTAAAASCSGSSTRIWPANTKITGNVTVSNNCIVTVTGDVWIAGTLTIRNSGRLVVADSLGATRPNIMVDGARADFQNSALLQSNASGTGFQVINYWSTAGCSPDCSNVTGTDLYNSRDDTTIELQQSASGPQTVFYSRWSRVQITNSGAIGALVGQTIDLRNSGTITFGTSVSGGGTTTWIIDGYRRSFN